MPSEKEVEGEKVGPGGLGIGEGGMTVTQFREFLSTAGDILYTEELLRSIILLPDFRAPTFLHAFLQQFISPNFVFRDVMRTFLETVVRTSEEYIERYKQVVWTLSDARFLPQIRVRRPGIGPDVCNAEGPNTLFVVQKVPLYSKPENFDDQYILDRTAEGLERKKKEVPKVHDSAKGLRSKASSSAQEVPKGMEEKRKAVPEELENRAEASLPRGKKKDPPKSPRVGGRTSGSKAARPPSGPPRSGGQPLPPKEKGPFPLRLGTEIDKGFDPNSIDSNRTIGFQMKRILRNCGDFVDVIVRNCFDEKLYSLSSVEAGEYLSFGLELFRVGLKAKTSYRKNHEFTHAGIVVIQKLIINGVDVHNFMIFDFLGMLFRNESYETCVQFINGLLDVGFDINYQCAMPFQVDGPPETEDRDSIGKGNWYTDATVVALTVIHNRLELFQWFHVLFGPVQYALQGEPDVGVRNLDMNQTITVADENYPNRPTEIATLFAIPIGDINFQKTGYSSRMTHYYPEIRLCDLAARERRGEIYDWAMKYYCEIDEFNNWDPFIHDISKVVYKPRYGSDVVITDTDSSKTVP